MHRFFIDSTCWQGDEVVLVGEVAHQICHVLRMRGGERIVVLDNAGQEAEVVLTAVEGKQVCGEVVERREASGEPITQVTLYQSYLKRDKFEWVLQKATEVGVSRIVPVVTERSLVQKKVGFKPQRLQRWRKILAEAAEQSHRGRIPELVEPLNWDAALQEGLRADKALIACPYSESKRLGCLLLGVPKSSHLSLFIGPEGGFSESEVSQACDQGVTPLNLGPRILRTETAAVVASSLILYECGEYQPPTLNP